jgi:radical SAM-linked protein
LKAQRIRIRYRVTPLAAGLGQRDMVSAWVEAADAAGLPLAYSESKRPSPQVALAAPLPLNVTSDAELVDVFMSRPVSTTDALSGLARHLPPGVEPILAEEVGVNAASLQSQLRWAEYEVTVPEAALSERDLQDSIRRLLAAETLPAEYRREAKVRHYDLRPLLLDLRLQWHRDGEMKLTLRLRAEAESTARADQVLMALGVPESCSIHRRRLVLEEVQPAVAAYRRYGEPETA